MELKKKENVYDYEYDDNDDDDDKRLMIKSFGNDEARCKFFLALFRFVLSKTQRASPKASVSNEWQVE